MDYLENVTSYYFPQRVKNYFNNTKKNKLYSTPLRMKAWINICNEERRATNMIELKPRKIRGGCPPDRGAPVGSHLGVDTY